MLPAISEFFKDTFTENITRLLQPASLIAASVFVILNLLFIFPTLADYDSSFIVYLNNLNPALQIVLAIAVVLVLAYLLLSFTSSILKLLTGELWEASPLAHLLTQRQKAERNRLIKLEETQRYAAPSQSLETRWTYMTNFPQERDYIGPTALGNVLNATASYIWNHYKIDMTALWPHMETVIANDSNTVLSTRINNEKATLDFLVNLTFVLILFAIEQILLQFFLLHEGWSVLWALVPLLLAYITYRAAVSKARTWGYALQIAFDIYRDKLAQALGLRAFTSPEDEYQVWRKVSSWLLWNNAADDVFANAPAKPSLTPSVSSSENVKVTLQHAMTDLAEPDLTSPAHINTPSPTIQRIYQYIDYTLLVSNPANNDRNLADGAYVAVSDPRISMIDPPPTAKDWDGAAYPAKVLPAPDPSIAHQLLWRIATLPPNGSIALLYRLPSRMFKATTNNPASLVISVTETKRSTGAITYRFSIKNTGGNDTEATLEVFDNRRSFPETSLLGTLLPQVHNIQAQKYSKPDRSLWTLGKLSPGAQITLQYTL